MVKMPPRGPQHVRQIRRAKRWLGPALACLALTLAFFVAPAAHAAAPWCGEHAQSIEAPTPIYPSRDAVLDLNGPCSGFDGFEVRSTGHERLQSSVSSGETKALLGARPLAQAPLRDTLPRSKSSTEPVLPRVQFSIDRPPR